MKQEKIDVFGDFCCIFETFFWLGNDSEIRLELFRNREGIVLTVKNGQLEK